MSGPRFVIKDEKPKEVDPPKEVELRKTPSCVDVYVNGSLVCGFTNGEDYLDLYSMSPSDDKTGLVPDKTGCVSVNR